MKTGKRVLSIVLAVVIMLSAAPLAGFVGLELAPKAKALAATGQCGDNVYWSFDESTGALYINGTGAMWTPDFMVENGQWDFRSDKDIKSITINNGVTNIPADMFQGCRNLISVFIPNTVERIGIQAFEYCSSLTSVTIPNSVTAIGNFAFYNCSKLSNLTIGNSVTTIGDRAFEYCKSLEHVSIPSSVTNIDSLAFGCCKSLSSFVVATSNPSYSSDSNGCLYNKDKTYLIQYPIGNKRTAFSVPGSVIGIARYAFLWSNLVSIRIPNKVSLESDVFCRCDKLTDITVYENNNDYTEFFDDDVFFFDIDGVLFQKHRKGVVLERYPAGKCLTSYAIPDGTTEVFSSGFSFCTNLMEVIIPEGVTCIGMEAFWGCSGLTSIIIPNGVKMIEGRTFEECINLKDVTIPNSVTRISRSAFRDCSLRNVYYNGTQEQWNSITDNNTEGFVFANIHYSSTGPSTDPDNPDNPDTPETGEVHADTFNPASSSGIYQFSGTLNDYVTTVVLNGSSAYVEKVTISGKKYDVKKDVLSDKKAQQLKGKNVFCKYDKKAKKIIAISKCREFSDLNQTDISTINIENRSTVKIANEYKWSSGKVRVAGGTQEVSYIPFTIEISNSIPSEYFDLSDNCKNNSAFDLTISKLELTGVENCGQVYLLDKSFPKTVKLGKTLSLEGKIALPSGFWLGEEDSEKTISAKYTIVTKSLKVKSGTFKTVVKNRDPKPQTYNESSLLSDAVNKLKKTENNAISLAILEKELGFSRKQIQYLEKLVLVELSLYTMPEETLEEYVKRSVLEKIFNAKIDIGVKNGKMTIVVPYDNKTKQVDIVCDIQDYSLNNRSFANFTNLTYHAYNVKNGKRDKVAFKNGPAGLSVSANVTAFAKAATDLALNQIKSATKTVLEGYEEVERIIFGETALKILSAAGYDSAFDFGWELYVNECKKLAYKCPVDIYVYDKNDTLCGAIVNNEVILDPSDAVDLEVLNDEKIVTLWDDGYYVKTLANCEGTLSITVQEKGYINGAIRTLSFENLPLSVGTLYRQGCGTGYYDDQSAYAVEELNGQMIEASSDILSLQFEQVVGTHTHSYTSSVTKQPTCTVPVIEIKKCTICGQLKMVVVPPLGHTDKDNDGKCDRCKEQMTGDDHCPQCGKIHKGFFQKIVGFFHKIIYKLTHLFSKESAATDAK